ncbi:MAG: hypothetical protein ACFCUQ_00315 [Kiloniellales bacterium]
MLRGAMSVFAAGCLGGLATILTVWLCGALGITGALGVAIAPPLTPDLLYRPIVWGGIWGFLFLLPLLPGKPWLRGLLFGLGPSLGQLLIVFPVKTDAGALGLGLGALTPLFVLLFNSVWGLVTAGLLEAAGRAAAPGATRRPRAAQ